MTEGSQHSRRKRLGFLLASAAVLAILLAIVIVPPLISISRYKNSITRLVAASMGRPVHLSSVELRLLPRPGFVMTDLSVDEDPAFGAEPILHANTVTASFRLLSLWRGRLEISSISVDEASVNLVRNAEGRWNLDALLRSAPARSSNAAQGKAPPFPYLEATDSRINLKNGLEKLPYSFVNADVSLWQEDPGDWRLRLRAQPARTDVSLDLADTGVVRLEARLRRAPSQHETPIHLELEWREAQLGQLSRLILGSDPGWRGDLTGELQLDGTPEAAQVKTRLKASGVHRAEFAPADPMDFDANCTFLYRYDARSIENLGCDSPLGDGHIHMDGDLPANGPGKLAVQIQKVPVSAGLDALRTLRSGIDESLEAHGTISGQLAYDPAATANPAPPLPPIARTSAHKQPSRAHAPPRLGPLQGSLTVNDLRLNGGGFSQPIQVAKIALEPENAQSAQPQGLLGTFTFPAGAPAPVAVAVNLAPGGYQFSLHGSASVARLRELAHVAGFADDAVLADLAGDPATLDLNVAGPWLPETPLTADVRDVSAPGSSTLPPPDQASDVLSGTITLHNANWKSDALANHVQITDATLHLAPGPLVWDPIAFSYGPVKGTATLHIPRACPSGQDCPPQLDLHFADLDAAALQAALLGARKPDTVLSTLIARISPSSPAAWPHLTGTLDVNTLILGPVKLGNVHVEANLASSAVELTSFHADLLGGSVEGKGAITSGAAPSYTFEATLQGLNGPAVCDLLALQCSGGQLTAHGKVELTGFSDRDLAASAKGTLHFEWHRGAFDPESAPDLPKALARFDRLTADAAIANNGAAIHQGQVVLGARKAPFDATVTFADPPIVHFVAPTTKLP